MYLFICIYVCMYVYICIYIYIYICVYVSLSLSLSLSNTHTDTSSLLRTTCGPPITATVYAVAYLVPGYFECNQS